MNKLTRFYKSLNLPWRREKYMGVDLEGNMYFQAPPIGATYKAKRFVLFSNGSEEYTPNSIDVVWSSWLRHTRTHPPSLQELKNDVTRKEELKILVAKINKRDEVKSTKREPAGQGDLFKPGEWKP